MKRVHMTCAAIAACAGAASMAVAGSSISADLIIAEGMVAPGSGGLVVGNLNDPFTDGNGRVGFTGSVDDGAGGTIGFVWYDTGVTWLNTDGLPDVLVGGEGSMGVGNAGDFIYSPSVNGNDAVWDKLGLVVQDTDAAPGAPGEFITFASRPSMAPNATAFWVSGLSATQGGSSAARALYRMDAGGSPTIVMRSGDSIDGNIIGASGIDFDYKFSDDTNHLLTGVTFTGSTATDTAMVFDGAIVAREGSAVPGGLGGENWQNFDSVATNNLGNYLFSGDTSAAGTVDEFIAYNSTIGVREGDVVDGVILAGSVAAVTLNNLNQAAYIWDSTDEQLFFAPDAANLSDAIVLLKTGADIDITGDTLPDFTVTDFNASGIIGPGLDMAEDGRIYVNVDLMPIGGGTEFEAIICLTVPSPGSASVLVLGLLAARRRR